MAGHHKFSLGGAAGYVGAFVILAVFFFTLGGVGTMDPLGAVLLLLMGVALGMGLSALLKRGAREAEREFQDHHLAALEDDEDDDA